VTVRPFNTFGPRKSARAVIPTIISQCVKDGIIRLGNLHPARDLNYVAKPVDGFVRTASSPEALGCTINIGSGREISIENLANMIGRLIGQKIEIQTETERVRPQSSEVGRLLADSTLARKTLGWEPSVSLEEGLQLATEWMREHLKWIP
jgi:dTDP-glucose 4,6-dehydratase